MGIDTTSPRTRRALLGAGLGVVAATAASALTGSAVADAASAVQLGAANAETTPTSIQNTNAGVAAVALSGRLTHAASGPASAGLKGQDDGTDGTGVTGVADLGTRSRGVYGQSLAGHGVEGASATGGGVFGHATSGKGVQGNSNTGPGVYGTSNGTGVAGVGGGGSSSVGVSAASASGTGLVASGALYGAFVTGSTFGVSASGVYSYYAPGGGAYGFYGSGSTSGADFFGGPWGAYGVGSVYGLEGIATPASGTTGYGVYGYSNSSGSTGYGTYGNSNYVGAYGYGSSVGALGQSGYVGVWGGTGSTLPTYGLVGYGKSYGLWCTGPSYAIVAAGNVTVSGTLSKSAGSFKIDHPLDPEGRWLSHSFVESPDMMNVYNGTAVLDAKGVATVRLPAYFGALNRDFRYQLTAVGGPAPSLHVAQEVAKNAFRIAGGAPGQKVSWQITGIRQDDYAQAHRIRVEARKTKAERGTRQFVPAGSGAAQMHLGPRQLPKEKAARPRQPLRPRQAA